MEPGVNSINFSNKVVIFMKAKWSEMKKIYKHSALPRHEAHLINIVQCTLYNMDRTVQFPLCYLYYTKFT